MPAGRDALEGVNADVYRRISELAAAQHGAVSAQQAGDVGATAKAVRRAVAAGLLVEAHSRVFVVAGSADTWLRRLHVGLLALGGRGWVSHQAAARLHGFDRFTGDVLAFTTVRARRGAASIGAVHTTERVGRLDLVTVDGLRCTSATRTILDLACVGVPETHLAAAIDSAVRLGLSAPAVIVGRLAELRGTFHRGARTLDALLVDAGGESMLERAFLRLVREAGLPRPRTQVVQRANGAHVARVDFLFEAERVVVEVSGRLGHSSPADRTRDAQRRNELIDLGYRPYEYTWSDVMHRPEDVTDSMRSRLDAATSRR